MDGETGPGLLTDRYELTMLDSWLAEGRAGHRAVFECFARRLPEGRRYGVVAGVGRLLDLLAGFRFPAAELDWLRATGAVSARAADHLAGYRFTGEVEGYREGELYFPGSPVLTVSGTLGDCVLLETLVLSVLNHDSAVASAASRMVLAAGGRPLIEMGSRRTHERSAVAAARAAYLAGFAATSNLAAGYRYGIPTAGTAAHAFMLSFADEREAFAAQVRALGPGTTLLVDTFDVEEGIRAAVEVAGTGLGAVRIDSGDLAVTARRARDLLDRLGARDTRIVVTSDLDEYVIAALGDAPVDSFGVGTRLVTGSGHPTASMVYKLVAVADEPGSGAALRPVAKLAEGKVGVGGRKTAYRTRGERPVETLVVAGGAAGESGAAPGPGQGPLGRRLTVPLMRGGALVDPVTLEQAREFAAEMRGALPERARSLTDGPPALVARPEVS